MDDERAANEWVTETLKRLVLDAPENTLSDFGGQAIFDAPLVGVADGDDPLFVTFRSVVSERHLLPREVLATHSPPGTDLTSVRVLAWALPFTEPVRRSNRGRDWPSRLYSAARNNGGALNRAVRQRLVEQLRERGDAAVAPTVTEQYDAFRSPAHTFTSTWSERHAAYAAGLGLFGLTGGLLTPVGAAVRLGSLVTNLPLEPTPRLGPGHRAPCLERGGDGCGRCIQRCPVGAISPQGLDKEKCYAMRRAVRERCLDTYAHTLHLLPAPIVKSGRREADYSLGCALCQCGVPCEGGWPQLTPREAMLHA
jgi:epoxyqueuosine reductase QueG